MYVIAVVLPVARHANSYDHSVISFSRCLFYRLDASKTIHYLVEVIISTESRHWVFVDPPFTKFPSCLLTTRHANPKIKITTIRFFWRFSAMVCFNQVIFTLLICVFYRSSMTCISISPPPFRLLASLPPGRWPLLPVVSSWDGGGAVNAA